MLQPNAILGLWLGIILFVFIRGIQTGTLKTSITGHDTDDGSILEQHFVRRFGPISLSDGYTVEWVIFEAVRSITFIVVVQTSGYVGFGVSSTGTKQGSDIVTMSGPANETIFLVSQNTQHTYYQNDKYIEFQPAQEFSSNFVGYDNTPLFRITTEQHQRIP